MMNSAALTDPRRRGAGRRRGWHTGTMSVTSLTTPAATLASQATPTAAAAAGALHEPCVLLKLGEVVLKGGNRQRFERMLHDNIRRAVRDLGVGIRIWQREGVIVLRVAPPGPSTVAAGEAAAALPPRPPPT